MDRRAGLLLAWLEGEGKRRRHERLLQGLEQRSLRDYGAVKLLEHIDTPPARELLDRLAGGAGARLT